MKCPDCEGTGEARVSMNHKGSDGDATAVIFTRNPEEQFYMTKPCPACNGTGEVKEEEDTP